MKIEVDQVDEILLEIHLEAMRGLPEISVRMAVAVLPCTVFFIDQTLLEMS